MADRVYQAKLAEQAERYREMADFMRGVCQDATEELSVEERNLVSVAYKNVVGARRAAWRVLSAIEQKHKESGEDSDASLVSEYRKQIEKEMDEVCDEVIWPLPHRQFRAQGVLLAVHRGNLIEDGLPGVQKAVAAVGCLILQSRYSGRFVVARVLERGGQFQTEACFRRSPGALLRDRCQTGVLEIRR